MKTIEITEQSIYQIKNILVNDSLLRKLIYINTPSALASTTNVTIAQASPLITEVPYVQDDDGVENSSQSNFIVVYPSYFDLQDDIEHKVAVSIDIFVYKDYYRLDDGKNRLTQLLNRVTNLLQDQKLAFAETMKISDVRLTSIDNGRTLGFLSTWRVTNGTAINY
jgi:hypothetical protein